MMTPAQADELDQLREENRQLRALLVPLVLTPPEWRLTRREQRVFAHLASRDVATRDGVMFAIGEGRTLGNQNVGVTIYKIRQKLPAGLRVATVWGVGYRLERDIP